MKNNYNFFQPDLYLKEGMQLEMKEKTKEKIIYAILLVVIIFISVLSLEQSPFFNGISNNDSSVFQIIGRGVLEGQVMYKDLYDHKGPIIFLINALAILINEQIGLFLVEIMFFWIGTIFIFKTSKIFLDNKKSFICCSIYLFFSFICLYGGNYTEEYAINIMCVALYYIIKIIHQREYKKYYWMIIGTTFLLDFLIKPTYISVYVAFGIAEIIFAIKEKRFKLLLKNVLYILIGILIVAIPIGIYLIINNNFNEFIEACFLMNIKYSNSSLKEKAESFIKLIKVYRYVKYIILAFVCNLFVIISKRFNKEIKLFTILFLVATIILTAWAPNAYHHYLVQMAPCLTLNIMLGIFLISKLIENKKIINQLPKRFIAVIIFVFIIAITLSFTLVRNGLNSIVNMQGAITKENLDEVKECLNEEDEMLVIGNEPYYYIYLEKQPKFKYFFQVPIIAYKKDVAVDTYEYVKDNQPKVIIVKLAENRNQFDRLYGTELVNFINSKYTRYDNQLFEYYVLKEE